MGKSFERLASCLLNNIDSHAMLLSIRLVVAQQARLFRFTHFNTLPINHLGQSEPGKVLPNKQRQQQQPQSVNKAELFSMLLFRNYYLTNWS